MPRSVFFPTDDVTHGEWRYLHSRYSPEEAQERRERLRLTLKRLTRRGHRAETLHRVLMHSIMLWQQHESGKEHRDRARKWNQRVERARRDVDRAIASLRQLAPPADGMLAPDDEMLFEMRELLLQPIEVPSSKRPRGGRPSEWKQEAEAAFRLQKVSASDSRELLAALGLSSAD